MAEQTNSGTNPSKVYKPSKGKRHDVGPYIGKVMDNYDPARSGRIQVWIEDLAVDPDNWITVSYMSPFFGTTPHAGPTDGTGEYVGNRNSYGMWFPVPDLGVDVIVMFIAGDHSQGYYIGSIPNPDTLHMTPAIGASKKFNMQNSAQEAMFGSASQLPVTEINDKNDEFTEDNRYFDKERPVHSVVAAEMAQQGVINDTVRGPIGSSSVRESPSNCFGISTPGRPIYKSGVTDYNITQSLSAGSPDDFDVVGRRGGHSLVMDDGNLTGTDNLVRIRTSKGHQITMSDDGNTIHIMHANGQSWVELGNEGTVDVYAANSVNIRSQGDLNFHADNDINMYAKKKVNIHSVDQTNIESEKVLNLIGEQSLTAYSKKTLVVRSDGTLSMHGSNSSCLNSDGPTIVNGNRDLFNTVGPLASPLPKFTVRTKLPDAEFSSSGWSSTAGKLDSIVSRAPTHEPYPEHNKGVATSVDYGGGGSTPASPSVQGKMDSINSTGVK